MSFIETKTKLIFTTNPNQEKYHKEPSRRQVKTSKFIGRERSLTSLV